MGQALSSVIRCLCGEAEEEERPSEQSLLNSSSISDSCSNSSIDLCIDSNTHGVVIDSRIQVLEDNRQVSPHFLDLIAREPRGEDQAKEEDDEEEKLIIISKEVLMKEEGWLQYYSSSHRIQIVGDSGHVSLPFLDLNTREPIEEDQEEKLIISEEVKMKEGWIQHNSVSDSIQAVEDDMPVSLPFLDLNLRELIQEDRQTREEDNEEEKLSNQMEMKEGWIHNKSSFHSIQIVEDSRQISPHFLDFDENETIEEDQPKNKDDEEKKLIISKEVVVKEERWIQHYSSSHKILLVGEGDFSFSASLAVAFGSAANMVATSLNSEGYLRANYAKALSNINELRNRGCTVMHKVDATKMVKHCSLMGKAFDRIIFNFPLVGFFPDESRESEIRRNQILVHLFLENAKKMISEKGEIHIAHKSWGFFLEWNLEHLASIVGLRLIEELPFNYKDYKGYHTKYGFGGDKNFNCNPCNIYKFGLEPRKVKYVWRRRY